MYNIFGDEDKILLPDHDDFEFHHRKSATDSAERILLEIGQKIVKHQYLRSRYNFNMFTPHVLSGLHSQLVSLAVNYPKSPSAVLAGTHTDDDIDFEKLFEGKWLETRCLLDFVAKFRKSFHEPFGR